MYVIDGYNIIKNPAFTRIRKSKTPAAQADLLKVIRLRHLTGSTRNRVIVVFDGFPPHERIDAPRGIEVVFSRDRSADRYIVGLIDKAAQPKNVRVVTNDRQVGFAVRSGGATPVAVEQFLGVSGGKKSPGPRNTDQQKVSLSYSHQEKINKELRKRWLNE